MKRFHIIWLIFSMLAFAAHAQNSALDTAVNVQFNNITLKQALTNISMQYGIRFSYSDSNIPVDRIIDGEFKDVSLRAMISKLLQQNDINFSIIENQLVLFPFHPNQTITVRGKVFDASNGTPVPYANIALSGTSKGTSSNQDGEFLLKVSKLPSELLVSHLNYEKKQIHVYNEDRILDIALTQAPRKLDEITVMGKKNKNTFFNMVKKAHGRLRDLSYDPKYGKAFYRQKTSREGKFTEIFELFYDIRYTENGIEDWAVQEGRYAFQQGEEYDIFLYNKNFTLLSRMFPIRQPATDSYLIPVNPDVKKYFHIELKDVLNYDDRLIGILAFKPKASVNIPAPEGELLIDLESYQVLKMKGTFRNKDLDIVGFADNNSNWENYRLDFQISFIDDPSDALLLDYVQIDHRFDYYFKDEFIGHINTSSLLTFYEHYSPVKNKRLGGPVNYSASDMEVIDAVGYDPDFWSANPIVKRTPLEEELIQDFEQNEAFGVVFLNNEEEVVLLADRQNSEKAQKVISVFEQKHTSENDHLIYLQFDKSHFNPGQSLQFTAFVLDRLTRKPFVLGSVLNVALWDVFDNLILEESFDISQGNAYGEIKLPEDLQIGHYVLKARTNIRGEQQFEQTIPVGVPEAIDFARDLTSSAEKSAEVDVEFFVEGDAVLEGVNAKYVIRAANQHGNGIPATWQITDQDGRPIATSSTNSQGIGIFEMAQYPGKRYHASNGDDKKWALPEAHQSGLALHVDEDISRSVQVTIFQKPALSKKIHILFASNGKVLNYFEKELEGYQSRVELPRQHFPTGVLTLFVIDEDGRQLSKRTFFIPPEELSIKLESVSWKSKRSGRVQLDFRISDQDNNPVEARLSAICAPYPRSVPTNGGIRNQVYFDGLDALSKVELGLANDSISSLIDALLIISDVEQQRTMFSSNSGDASSRMKDLTGIAYIDEPVVAELNISGSYSPDEQFNRSREVKGINRKQVKDEHYWIPKMELDEAGKTSFHYKLPKKNKPFYVQIQGISQNGKIGYGFFEVDPQAIRK